MSISGVSCFNQFLVSNPLNLQAWADDNSVSHFDSQSFRFGQSDRADQTPLKSDPLLADQTTYNSGKKMSESGQERRTHNPMYSLEEDVLIYSKVSASKNKLSAKKMVAAKLGRSYSGILNRYHILKSLPQADLTALMAKAAQAETGACNFSAVIKRAPGSDSRKSTWRLSHFQPRADQPEDTHPSTPLQSSEWGVLAGELITGVSNPKTGLPPRPLLQPSNQSSAPKISKRRVRKVAAPAAPNEKKVRGPYKTKQVRERERIKGLGSARTSDFLSILLAEGIGTESFTCEEVLENVFEKHRHSARVIETVLNCCAPPKRSL